ncbi:MAG TPA: NAD(P)-dependent oxidoreductase [Candidatus Acidoferrum sp.]|nr:NAD(P)-dependent oxidoreductase [Candidatus Acidoferrum sp.]
MIERNLERFPDLHPAFDSQSAVTEANRCLYCFNAPCMDACPTHIDVPRFIKKIASGNLRGSAATILDANILGLSCSRVCPVEVLCEGSCVMHGYNKKPIEIGRLQRYAMENAVMPPRAPAPSIPLKVACIGGGPASLACAAELRKQGASVTVFDNRPLPGGLNTYGVAEYKLRPQISLKEVEMVRAMGVEFRHEEIGATMPLADLEKQFDFIFIGVGLGAMERLGIPGEDLPGVVDALRFIERYKTQPDFQVGRSVIVIGGGNTAIDAANAAVRLGAEEVQLFYRRSDREMPAFPFEYDHSKIEGVHFHWLAQPVAIIGKEGRAAGVRFLRTRLEDRRPVAIPNSEFEVSCDMVVPALGQSRLTGTLPVDCNGGSMRVDHATGRTSHPKYYAGGDCVNGGREVVDAVADGKRAALGMLGRVDLQVCDPASRPDQASDSSPSSSGTWTSRAGLEAYPTNG